MIPSLNWKEWKHLRDLLAPRIEGLFVERILVPERTETPAGYFKNEWVFRLTGRKEECFLTLSLRPQYAVLTWAQGKNPKASAQATHSPFSLALSKHLRGTRISSLEALDRERTLILWCTQPEEKDRLGLVLTFIPASPEAWIIEEHSNHVLAHSKKTDLDVKMKYERPKPREAPTNLEVRLDWVSSLERLHTRVEEELRLEAFQTRLKSLKDSCEAHKKQAEKRLKEAQNALKGIEKDPPFMQWGGALKAVLHDPPPLVKGKRRVQDLKTEEWIEIPCSASLTAQAQAERFFNQSKRAQRKRQELTNRIESFESGIESARKAETQLKSLEILKHPDFKALEAVEFSLGLGSDRSSKKAVIEDTGIGKLFISKDGFQIRVGRSRDENLELTMRAAKGNDLWLHVKGRPGAHVVVNIPPKKSAPLETLLDAAHLAIHYSGGQEWGKTEVDYTFRKHIKRIKNSTEVSYTHNKTLAVTPDKERMRRLLGQ